MVFFKREKNLHDALKHFDLSHIKNKKLPVKLHMGETRNKNHVTPSFLKMLTDDLRTYGSIPFLFDSTVAYHSLRRRKIGYMFVAITNGFLKAGCKIVIGNKGKQVMINGKTFEIVNELYNSSSIVVVSHATGHAQTGFAGAIKNLGMGGITKKSKRMIHFGSSPIYHKKNCTFCGNCAEVCPYNAIKVETNKWIYDSNECMGCGQCVNNCPSNALIIKEMDLERALALSAKVVQKDKHVIYINVLKNITPVCDCMPFQKQPICPDIGYLISEDPVAIDKASIDLINTYSNDDLKKITGIDPNVQLQYGEEIGLGTTEYNIIQL